MPRGAAGQEIRLTKQEGQTAGFGPCFHLPGFYFGAGFLSHSQVESGARDPAALIAIAWVRFGSSCELSDKTIKQAERDESTRRIGSSPRRESGAVPKRPSNCSHGAVGNAKAKVSRDAGRSLLFGLNGICGFHFNSIQTPKSPPS